MGTGFYCDGDISARPPVEKRTFRCWYEPWEHTVFKPGGNQYFAAFIDRKYGGLSFKALDDGRAGWIPKKGCAVLIRCSKHKTKGSELQGKNGHNYYYGLLICYEGYDPDLPHKEQSDKLYDILELKNSDFYGSVYDYYKENPVPGVTVFHIDSDEPSWVIPGEYSYARDHGLYVADDYGVETTWELRERSTTDKYQDGKVVASGGPYTSDFTYDFEYCLYPGKYTFVFYDWQCDGLIGKELTGSYTLKVNGKDVHTGGTDMTEYWEEVKLDFTKEQPDAATRSSSSTQIGMSITAVFSVLIISVIASM